jgi:deoxycytidylate deaminase
VSNSNLAARHHHRRKLVDPHAALIERIFDCRELDGVLSGADLSYLKTAVKAAQFVDHPQWRVGAAIGSGGRHLAWGWNKYRNDPASCEHAGVSWHAEEKAIKNLGVTSARRATIYVARLGRLNQPMIARPCARCMLGIKRAGISEIVYTTSRIDMPVQKMVVS